MEENLKLEWKLANDPLVDIGFALVRTEIQHVQDQMPDLADMFPFRETWTLKGHLDDGWLAIQLLNRNGSGVPTVLKLEDAELEVLTAKVLPFSPRNHRELATLLGNTWFSSGKFTYVGPYSDSFACWPDIARHLIDWLNAFVVPEVLKRNQERVMRAIPPSPVFSLERIQNALWILECEETMKQGTAFNLAGVGLVTCEHVLGSSTYAFKADNIAHKYPIKIRSSNPVIDLAVLTVDVSLEEGLPVGSADSLKQMDHLAVTGFPNYRLGDSGVIVPGLVIGFRTVSSIRRILTNAPIIAGNSGGPVLDKNNSVIGVAVTGAECMEKAQETEDHGIIPIDALSFLST